MQPELVINSLASRSRSAVDFNTGTSLSFPIDVSIGPLYEAASSSGVELIIVFSNSNGVVGVVGTLTMVDVGSS